jgi:DNA invertase Pin-like site-specific DNA recombinase
MNGCASIVQQRHLQRKAVVYVRQSTPRQVMKNTESARVQRQLKDRALELGWKPEQVEVIDEDLGLSGRETEAREGFSRLLSDVCLEKVGIVLSFDASRMSRKFADWYRLMEMCGTFGVLIGDAGGLYDPRHAESRLLLGLKGTISEAEWYSIRARLDAGRLSKARRGELVQRLPVGYVRLHGRVALHPDESVRQALGTVFAMFRERGSISSVARQLQKNHVLVPARSEGSHSDGQVDWREATHSAIDRILRNPAYAGYYAYGMTRAPAMKPVSGRSCPARIKLPRDQWTACVPGVYPAYISAGQFEENMKKIEGHRHFLPPRGHDPIKGALLVGMIRCGRCGRKMMVTYKGDSRRKGRYDYFCTNASRLALGGKCPRGDGETIDHHVSKALFEALAGGDPMDALETYQETKQREFKALVRSHELNLQRLEYEARRAEKHYRLADPENRLVAGTLERNWEEALAALEQAAGAYEEFKKTMDDEMRSWGKLPPDITARLRDAGRRLPEMWPRISLTNRRRLARALIHSVTVERKNYSNLDIGIIWHGGLRTRIRGNLLRGYRWEDHPDIENLSGHVFRFIDQGMNRPTIVGMLNALGLKNTRGETFTPTDLDSFLACPWRQSSSFSPLTRIRRGEVPQGYLTVKQLAERLAISRWEIYSAIKRGNLDFTKDPRYRVYLLHDTPETLEKVKAAMGVPGRQPHEIRCMTCGGN